jgi:hypothetical protein
MPLLALSVFLSMQWWAAYYPGAEPGGGGYVAQRIFSAKTERDGVLATLFFQVAHYALRPWPWIITGLATVILYPTLQDKEAGYVHAFVDLLPTPVAGLHARRDSPRRTCRRSARISTGARRTSSTTSTSASPEGREREALRERRSHGDGRALPGVHRCDVAAHVGREGMGVPARHGCRHGLVLILRWYWWRINAWSEISAMVVSFLGRSCS